MNPPLYVVTFLALLMLMIQLIVRVWIIDELIAKMVTPLLIVVLIFLVRN